jgi:hypothetical protein
LKYRRRTLRSPEDQERIRLIANICEEIYSYRNTEAFSILPPPELQLLHNISAPGRDIPRILRSFTAEFEKLLQMPNLVSKEMDILRKLATLKGGEISSLNIPELVAYTENNKGMN